jgi:tRNA A-37 threonylcarbamoyl transferase component Bud32
MSSNTSSLFAEGTVIGEKYRLVRLLGEGGMGQVFEAHHTVIGRRFAIKFLHPFLAGNEEITARFRNEAQAAGKLENENIAAAVDFGSAPGGTLYLVMEFLEGDDLARLLSKEGALPVVRTVNLLIQACRGLAAAHDRGIIHRDLKPENLFVVPRADGELLKILDFGIAKLRGNASVTRSGTTMGTPCYMSLEQARGAKEVDHRSDIYALGVIAYECLSGQKAFPGENYAEVLSKVLAAQPFPLEQTRPDLPGNLGAVVRKAMARDADDRFASVIELAEALIPFAGRQVTPLRAQAGARVAGPNALPANAATMTSTDSLAPEVAEQGDDAEEGEEIDSENDESSTTSPRWKVRFVSLGAVVAALALGAYLFFGRSPKSVGTAHPAKVAPEVSRAAAPVPAMVSRGDAGVGAQAPNATAEPTEVPKQRPGGRPPGQVKPVVPARAAPMKDPRTSEEETPIKRTSKHSRTFDRTNPYEN